MPLLASIALVFLPQVIVWIAWVEVIDNINVIIVIIVIIMDTTLIIVMNFIIITKMSDTVEIVNVNDCVL